MLQFRAYGPGDDWSHLPVGPRHSVRYRDLANYCDAFSVGESELNFGPLLDAIIRGEGEWRKLPGVSYLGASGEFVTNPPPNRVPDLDALPFMARDVLEMYLEKFPGAVTPALNLGRGCYYRCSFCTVHAFQQLQEGSSHRQRSVESVLDEIRYLHERYGLTEFDFEDDNFIIKNQRGFQKIRDLCDGLRKLPFQISFSIFCRADVIQPELFTDLREAGLRTIFLGLESVHEPHLEFFHKGLRLRDIDLALRTLISLGYTPDVDQRLRVKVGFIAWHPLTTVDSLRDSVRFIREFAMPPKLLRRKLLLYSASRSRSRSRRWDSSIPLR